VAVNACRAAAWYSEQVQVIGGSERFSDSVRAKLGVLWILPREWTTYVFPHDEK